MATADAGVHVACPRCGKDVLRKAMIPVLGDGGEGVGYLCQACARLAVAVGTDTAATD